MLNSLSHKEKFVTEILNWFNNNKRSFPWRCVKDPYKILITENMLRKTTAKQVNDIWVKFFTKYPNIKELSTAPIEELSIIVRPLGLQNQRAKNLLNISKKLLKYKEFPSQENELLQLPGVGRYAVDSVLCLAFDQDMPMVDRNAIRVINRVFQILPEDIKTNSEKAAKIIRDFVFEILPNEKARDFNFGIIDFAWKVCKAKSPLCLDCLIGEICTHVRAQKIL